MCREPLSSPSSPSSCPSSALGRGAVVWLTGLSGSGKTTLARALAARIDASGRGHAVLDGDDLRRGLCRDLSFSPEDRAENIRRVGEVAALMADTGLIVICALISPYAAGRAAARRAVAAKTHAPPFLEVFVDAPLSTCERRDVKGLYARVRRGDLFGFTGVDAPYARGSPFFLLRTAQSGPYCVVQRIFCSPYHKYGCAKSFSRLVSATLYSFSRGKNGETLAYEIPLAPDLRLATAKRPIEACVDAVLGRLELSLGRERRIAPDV